MLSVMGALALIAVIAIAILIQYVIPIFIGIIVIVWAYFKLDAKSPD